jgi:exonuclease VII small subunit
MNLDKGQIRKMFGEALDELEQELESAMRDVESIVKDARKLERKMTDSGFEDESSDLDGIIDEIESVGYSLREICDALY